MNERWDVVDITKDKTGFTCEKGAATIPEGSFHIGVSIWVKSNDDKFLLLQRNLKKGNRKLDCIKGAILSGETSKSGAERILFEETGLVVEESKLHFLGSNVEANNQNGKCDIIVDSYIYLIDENTEDVCIMLNGYKNIDAKWLDIKSINENKDEIFDNTFSGFSDNYIEILKYIN